MYFSIKQNQFYLNLNNKKYVLDLEAKFTEQGFLLKRDYWREGKLHRLDIVYDKKISGKYLTSMMKIILLLLFQKYLN